MFDFLCHCPLLVRHAAQGKIGFGINHEMIDFRNNRDKDLDLVVCTRGHGRRFKKYADMTTMAERLQSELSPVERSTLGELPDLEVVPVGSVLVALEAKACMTEHNKAIPRLHDELNSSHLIVHGATDAAIAAGFTMVNVAERFVSPSKNPKPISKPIVWNRHRQPEAAEEVIKMIADIPRRTKSGDTGYDALAIVVIECLNDGITPVSLVEAAPAPTPGSAFHYSSMIERLSHIYATRFVDL